jgi:YjbE family integral membrane protein
MIEILRGYVADVQPQFWASVVEIIWINVLLSGDNAIVIALACRNLPPKQRLAGMVLGTAAALLLRLAFASVVSMLVSIPYLKIAGGAALLWIAGKLLAPDDASNEPGPPSKNVLQAVKAIAIADVVMSLDNVIAVVAAADGNFALLVFGLGISIPIIVAGATIVMAVLNYLPIIVWAGAALLGWIAGEVIGTDAAVLQYTASFDPALHEHIRLSLSIAGMAGILLTGALLRIRQARHAVGGPSPGR